jgi:hypothetical protein
MNHRASPGKEAAYNGLSHPKTNFLPLLPSFSRMKKETPKKQNSFALTKETAISEQSQEYDQIASAAIPASINELLGKTAPTTKAPHMRSLCCCYELFAVP